MLQKPAVAPALAPASAPAPAFSFFGGLGGFSEEPGEATEPTASYYYYNPFASATYGSTDNNMVENTIPTTSPNPTTNIFGFWFGGVP
jgi:hypothetical protein